SGLIIATLMAGVMLIIMGFARLGAVIKFIPHSLIIGFTSGIAVIIFSSQIKDFFGLSMGEVPADFLEKSRDYLLSLSTINIYAVIIARATIAILIWWPRLTQKIPGSLIAIIIATVVVQFFDLPVETIGSRFGVVSSSIPMPEMPSVDWA